MATVNFLYRSIKPNACLNIRLLFRYNGKDYDLSSKTKIEVDKSYWNKMHTSKSKDISIINKQIEINTKTNQITKHVLGAFNKISSPEHLNKKWLDKQISIFYNPNKPSKSIPNDLVRFIDYYIEQRKDEVRSASITKFNVIKHKLQRLETALNKTIFINEINEDFKQEFVNYCRIEKYSQNTIQKELNIIKTFCKYARHKGIVIHSELDSLKLPKEKTEKIYLTFEEIQKIEKVSISLPHLMNARDWLIISCFTGQRISDFMRFTKEMIRVENGNYLIEFQQQKTRKLMTIPLHKKVLDILNKNDGEFPRNISHQRYNEYIKEVCKLAEINEMIQGKMQMNILKDSNKKQINISKDSNKKKIRNVLGVYPKYKLVTSHIGRRSFATNHYGTIPTSNLIYMTGHSSEVMFLNYIGKSNKDMAIEIAKYFF